LPYPNTTELAGFMKVNDTPWPVKILPVKLPVEPRPVAIMRLKNRTLSPVAQAFIDCAKVAARTIRVK
jgi:DNA-binding transcriptional LysR family regulator